MLLACKIPPNHQHLCPIFCLFVPSVRGADAGNGIRVFIPDIGMFMVGLGIWLLCRSLVQKRPPEDMAQYNEDFQSEEQVGFIWAEMKSVCLDGLKSSFNFVVVHCNIFLLHENSTQLRYSRWVEKQSIGRFHAERERNGEQSTNWLIVSCPVWNKKWREVWVKVWIS